MVVLVASWGFFTVWSQLTENDGWKVLTDEDQIIQRLLQRNGTHLSISGESPFARGYLADALGKDGEGGAVEDILKGEFKYDTDVMDDIQASSEMKSFIGALKTPISGKTGKYVPTMDTTMDIEQHREVFKKTRESTASSPSGIHYGHYIAAFENDLLSEVNMIFMVVHFQVGLPLSRWTQSLHCMMKESRNRI